MINSFAWRNVWRNKVRSSIVIISVTLGIFAGIFIIAFFNGSSINRIQTIILTEIAHIQIHQQGFLDNSDFSIRIKNADSVVNKTRQALHVKAVSKRIIINSMVASAEANAGVKIIGIDPADEKKITNIHQKITEGTYLDETGKNTIVIGRKLAHKLNVGLKNKVIITVQDVNKNINGGAFRIVGIYETNDGRYDESVIFVRNNDISRLTDLDGKEAHEIAILVDDGKCTEEAKNIITGYFPAFDVQNWLKISPEAGFLVSAMEQYMFVIILVILLALCFGIINTMLMVVLERVHELGMLMAIGMNKLKVFFMIMLETIFLSLIGGIFGIIIGYLVSNYFGKKGLNLFFFKEAFEQMGYSSIIYTTIDVSTMIIIAIMVIIAGIFSALYPAYKALKLNPSESIRT